MVHDPITFYFTSDRRNRYRELHERYPLWCGDWPEPTVVEAWGASRERRYVTALQEMEDDRSLWHDAGWKGVRPDETTVTVPEPTADSAPVPYVRDLGSVTSDPPLPAVLGALLAAIG